MKIAIIGAGWAGLSCAHKLIELDSKNEITIFESAPNAGGRAKGIVWKLSNGDYVDIDNGQHFIIGAYKSTLTLLKKTNSPEWCKNIFTWNFSAINEANQIHEKFELSFNHFISQLFLRRSKWPKHWYLCIFFSVLFAKQKFIKIDGTAKDWLSRSLQPKKLQQVFWRPFIESTTNTDWREASAKSIVTILNECSDNFPKSLEILHPKNNLTINGLDFIVKDLKSNGVEFFFGNTVSKITKKMTFINNRNVEYEKFDEIVLALPTFSAQKIWNKSDFRETTESKNWKVQDTRGINTLWIALPESFKRVEEPSNKNYWEIRQLSGFYDDSFFVIIERPLSRNRLIISVVQSAVNFNINNIQIKNFEKMKVAANGYLKSMFDLSLESCEYKFISEKRATFACSSELSDKETLWGTSTTGRMRIWRCSDDCTFGFPSTIESAVRSGSKVAESIMVKAN